MKTTVDIPDTELEDVMRFTGATTKREAIVTAIADYNRRRRMAAMIVAHADEVRIGLGVIQHGHRDPRSTGWRTYSVMR